MVITEKSSLTITKGSTSNGYVGYYAQVIDTELDESKGYVDENGYILYTDGEYISLIGYAGTETDLVLPNGITDINQSAFENCTSLTTVYYSGTAQDWAKISISSYNTSLTNATRYYYSESAPTKSGNYWHYVDGVVTKW